MHRTRSRRHPLTFAVVASLMIAAAACGDDDGAVSTATSNGPSGTDASEATSPESVTSPTAGSTDAHDGDDQAGWTFTDDLGRTVELPDQPERVAGLTDVISGLWRFGVQPVAAFGYTSMADDVQFEGLDIDEVAEVGGTYGEINMEALRAAEPDLIVTTTYTTDPDELLYGFNDEAQLATVEEIAPVVAITMVGDGADVIESMARLAEAVGADLESDRVARAKADYDDARARLAEAGERNLAVLPLAAYDDVVYLAEADDDPALHMYKDAGVDFVDLETDLFFWEEISWERIDKYDADLILYSLRAMDPDAMKDVPTFAALPAAQAEQVQPWKYVSMDYESQAAYMNELAEWIEGAEPVATG